MPAQAIVIVPYLQNHPAAAVRQLRDYAVGLDQRWRHAGKLVGQQPVVKQIAVEQPLVPGQGFAVQVAVHHQPDAADAGRLVKTVGNPIAHSALPGVLVLLALPVDAVPERLQPCAIALQNGIPAQRTDGTDMVGQKAIVILQHLLQLADVLRRHLGRQAAVLPGDSRSRANCLPQQRAGAHHAGGAHGRMRNGDIAPGEHQIWNGTGIQAAKGNAVGRRSGMENVWRLRGAKARGMMIIHRPAAVGHLVIKAAAGKDIIFGHGKGAGIAPAFALSGQRANPAQAPVLMLPALGGIVLEIQQ